MISRRTKQGKAQNCTLEQNLVFKIVPILTKMIFQNFTLDDGKLVQVPMMSRTSNEISAAKFNLSEIDDVFQTVAIPYAVSPWRPFRLKLIGLLRQLLN